MDISFTIKESNEIKTHALESFPNECVGFLQGGRYHRLQNVSKSPTKRYELSLEDKIFLNRLGSLTALVHSHPILENIPSEMDLQAQQSTGFNFLIVGTNGVETTEIGEYPYARAN